MFDGSGHGASPIRRHRPRRLLAPFLIVRHQLARQLRVERSIHWIVRRRLRHGIKARPCLRSLGRLRVALGLSAHPGSCGANHRIARRDPAPQTQVSYRWRKLTSRLDCSSLRGLMRCMEIYSTIMPIRKMWDNAGVATIRNQQCLNGYSLSLHASSLRAAPEH